MKSTKILKLKIANTKRCYVFKTALTKFDDTTTISDVFHSKNVKVEEVIEVKVGSDKELNSVDLDGFHQITLSNLSTFAPEVVKSVKM